MTRHARHLTQSSLPLFDALVETRVANRQQEGRSAATSTFACEAEKDSGEHALTVEAVRIGLSP